MVAGIIHVRDKPAHDDKIVKKLDKENDQQLIDIIDLKDSSLSLDDIALIANDDEVRKRYENKYGSHLYAKILLLLTHESYGQDEAKSLWKKIMCHLNDLNHKLGRNVGISVATLDYLSNIRNKLSTPVIIEEDKSIFVSKTTTKDELTGLYLKTVFDVVLKQHIEETNRDSTPLSLLIIDIDDFKSINDTYGHLTGDHVLSNIGLSISDCARKMDFPARYGGEEFTVIMPGADTAQAFKAAERIRKTISQLKFIEFNVTVSIGVSQANRKVDTPDKLIHAADTALYEAKQREKLCCYS